MNGQSNILKDVTDWIQQLPTRVKVLSALCATPIITILLDLASSRSWLAQYVHLVLYGLTFIASFVMSDLVLCDIVKPKERSLYLTKLILKSLQQILSSIGNKIKERHKINYDRGLRLNSSPKRRQRLLQQEIEIWLKTILGLYVKSWAVMVNPYQTLVDEVENDLRTSLQLIIERLKNIDNHLLFRDLAAVLVRHIHKLRTSRFDRTHPALASRIGSNTYVLLHTVILLKKFGFHKSTASGAFTFDCLSRVVNFNITWSLVQQVKLTPTETTQVTSENPEHAVTSAAVTTLKRWHSDSSGSATKGQSRPVTERSTSESCSAGKRSDVNPRRTLDLTGYSVRDGKTFPQPPGSGPGGSREPSGKISMALGGLFSATAGPLLPDNIAFKSFNKMWRSQSQSQDDVHLGDHHSNSSSPIKKLQPTKRHERKSSLDMPVDKRKPFQKSPSFDIADVRGSSRPHIGEIYSKESPAVTSADEIRGSIQTLPSHFTFNQSSEASNQHQGASNESLHHQQQQMSPLYDEHSGDLETTISKLRALLEEKEVSGTSSGDSENGGGLFDHPQKRRPRWSGTLTHDDLPADGRLILNVSIPETETVTVESESTSPGGRFDESLSLYCIHYDGIYLETVAPDIASFGMADYGQTNSSYRYVLKRRVVKRRFKEFLNLQMRFEDNPRLCKVIKGIKGPNKWLNLPFTKQNEQTIEIRRIFFEKWLENLCCHSEVVLSNEFKDFLAYADDGSVAYVRKPGFEDTKIDRLLLKTVGVIHSIKDALPHFDDGHSHLSNVPAVLVPNHGDFATTPNTNGPKSLPDGIFFGLKKSTPASYKVVFDFIQASGHEAFEFPGILDMFCQRFDQRSIKLRQQQSKEDKESEAKSGILDLQTELEHLQLFQDEPSSSQLMIELMILVVSSQQDFVSRQVVLQLCLRLFNDTTSDLIDFFISELSSDESLLMGLKWLRHQIWEQDQLHHEIIEEKDEDQTGSNDILTSWSSLDDVLNCIGLSTEQFQITVRDWFADGDKNEELALNLLDVITAHLTDDDDGAVEEDQRRNEECYMNL